MTCEECQDLLLLYITGALEPGEEAAVRAHLAKGCPACAAELAANEATVHQLPLALAATPPPANAWDKIETRIALDEPSRTRSVSEGHETDRAVLAAPFTHKPKSWAWTGWAAAAVIAIVMGLALKNVNDSSQRFENRVAALETDLKQVSQKSDLQIAQYTSQIEALRGQLTKLQSPAQFTITSPEQPAAKGTVLVNFAANTLRLSVDGANPPEAGKTYELWIITAGKKALAAGTAKPDASGKLVFTSNLPVGTIIATAAVTDEKEGGEPDDGAKGKVQFIGTLAPP